jgi:cold shock CspA family protein/ribosome-associated translation inhibitor RaiA
MEYPLQITFRNIKSSETIEDWVRTEASKLDTFYNRVMGCRVTIEIPHRHHKKGSRYHIRIDLTVPGEEIVVNREPSLSQSTRQSGETQLKKRLEVKTPHKDLHRAINHAFRTAARRLQDFARRQRGQVKSHAPLQMARVSKIVPGQAYGFLTPEDGREIYFHRNSVLNCDFSRLKVGTRVSFVEEPGEKGPQASTVRVVGKGKVLGGATPLAAVAIDQR